MPARNAVRHPEPPLEDADDFAVDAPHKARAIAALLADNDCYPSTILDYGCGTGDVGALLARTLAARGRPAAVVGYEPRPPARQRLSLVGAPSGRWDVVLAVDVAEHAADDIGLLAAAAALGERLVVRLPLDLSVWDVARPARLHDVRRRYGHEHVYDAVLARQRAEAAGLRVLDARLDRLPRPARGLDRLRDALPADLAARWLGGWSWLALCAPPYTTR